jgi:hypothetical protein
MAGISWTMSSELAAYDSINYGLWCDDAQFARVALKHASALEKLKVKRIVIGECGHAGPHPGGQSPCPSGEFVDAAARPSTTPATSCG